MNKLKYANGNIILSSTRLAWSFLMLSSGIWSKTEEDLLKLVEAIKVNNIIETIMLISVENLNKKLSPQCFHLFATLK